MANIGVEEVRAAVVSERTDLLKFARSLTKNYSSADDLVQQTSVRALTAAHQYQAGTNVRAWLFTIMRHLFMNGARGTGREVVGIDAEWDVAIPADGDSRLALDDVFRALAELPAPMRRLLLEAAENHDDHETIARMYRCPIGTVNSRVSRARTALREILARGPALPRSR